MFLPKYCEKLYVIVDLGGKGLHNAPIRIFNRIAKTITTNFFGILERLWIYNSSSLFKKDWQVLIREIPIKTAERIQFTEKGMESEISTRLGTIGLETTYGGTVGKIMGSYWPPRPNQKEDAISHDEIDAKSVKLYSINGEEYDKKRLFPGRQTKTIVTHAAKNWQLSVPVILLLAIVIGIILAVVLRKS